MKHKRNRTSAIWYLSNVAWVGASLPESFIITQEALYFSNSALNGQNPCGTFISLSFECSQN